MPAPYDTEVVTSPTLDVITTRGLGLAMAIDDQPPQVVNLFTPLTYKDEDNLGRTFNVNVQNNACVMHFRQTVSNSGRHTLKTFTLFPPHRRWVGIATTPPQKL